MNQTILIGLPMLAVLFWLLQYVFERKKNTHKFFFTFFLGLLFFNFMVHTTFFNKQYNLYSFLDSIWVFTSLSVYPTFYYYIRLLTKDVEVNSKWLLLLTPAILMSLYSAIMYLLMNPSEVNIFIHGIMYNEIGFSKPYPLLVQLQNLRLYLFKAIFSIEVILAVYFSMKLINDFKKKVKSFYPETSEHKLAPLNWLVLLLFISSFVSIVSNILGKSFFALNYKTLFILSIAYTVELYALGYIGFKQSFTIENYLRHVNAFNSNKESITKIQEKSINKTIKSGSHILVQLHNLLEEKQVFKDADLKISDLAIMLGSNRTYVSQIINEEMQTSFTDLINSYRIKNAEELLRSYKSEEMALIDIGLDSGFSSPSTFYRIFKNKNGVSPGVYREQIQEKVE